jgi:hypothetical protein
MRNIIDHYEKTLRTNTTSKNVRYRYIWNGTTFYSPSLEVIDKIKPFLIANADYVLFEPKYVMRPEYLSYDQYGTTDYWYILMYINNIFTISEFNMTHIYIPRRTAMQEILSKKIAKTDTDRELNLQ